MSKYNRNSCIVRNVSVQKQSDHYFSRKRHPIGNWLVSNKFKLIFILKYGNSRPKYIRHPFNIMTLQLNFLTYSIVDLFLNRYLNN